MINPGVSRVEGEISDDALQPSDMTDYRGVDAGLTSIGSTDQNADQSTMSGLGVPGVRMGDGFNGGQSGGVGDSDASMGGILDDTSDARVGDRDDKAGGRVLNDPTNTSGLGSSAADTATLGATNTATGQGSS